MNVSDQNPRGCDCAYLSWGHSVGAVTNTLVDTMAVNDDDGNVEVRQGRRLSVTGVCSMANGVTFLIPAGTNHACGRIAIRQR